MKKECNNIKESLKLHAYELDLLTEKETDEFELHLMDCDGCLKQVESFNLETRLLNTSRTIKEKIGEMIKSANRLKDQPYTPTKIRQRRFTNDKLIIGIIMLAILVAIGLSRFGSESAHNSLQIKLTPSRSTSSVVVKNETDLEFEFLFVYENSVAGKCYLITIYDSDETEIYQNNGYCQFNSRDLGRLNLDAALFPTGRYIMTISDPENSSQSSTQEYRFTIAKK